MSPAPDYFLEHALAAIIAAAITVYALASWARHAWRQHQRRNRYTTHRPRVDSRDTLEFFKRRNSR